MKRAAPHNNSHPATKPFTFATDPMPARRSTSRTHCTSAARRVRSTDQPAAMKPSVHQEPPIPSLEAGAIRAIPPEAPAPCCPVVFPTAASAREPAPGSPEALALLATLGIAPRPGAGEPLGPDDERFSPVAIGHLTHRLVEVKLMVDQLSAEQKELHETLRLAHLRGDLLHLRPSDPQASGYQLPEGPQLHRRSGRKQWRYSAIAAELEAQLKARQTYEQTTGEARCTYGAGFWELRFSRS